MENTQRNAYDAAFKLKAIDLAVEKGKRAAARKLGINESMVRDVGDGGVKNWLNAKRRQKLSEVIKADGPNLKMFLKTGWTLGEQAWTPAAYSQMWPIYVHLFLT